MIWENRIVKNRWEIKVIMKIKFFYFKKTLSKVIVDYTCY